MLNDMIIPGNDDAIRSIRLITKVISDACARGIESAQGFVPKSDSPVIKKVKKEDVQKLDDAMEAPIEETLESDKAEEVSSEETYESDKTEKLSIDEVDENTTIEDKKEEK